MEEKLIRLQCKKCTHTFLCWEDKKPSNCPKCNDAELSVIVNANTVPVTTGHMVEYLYDNVDTIDSFVSEQASIEDQERDLNKLAKGRKDA